MHIKVKKDELVFYLSSEQMPGSIDWNTQLFATNLLALYCLVVLAVYTAALTDSIGVLGVNIAEDNLWNNCTTLVIYTGINIK